MKYIFHLGRVPELSLAEIQAVLEKTNSAYSVDFVNPKMLIVEAEKTIDFENIFPKMGGTIKISKVLFESKNFNEIFEKIASDVKESNKERLGKKILGYSAYFTKNIEKNRVFEALGQIRKSFITTKKKLSRETGVRIVFPDENGELKSASVINNKILEKGGEFNFIFFPDKIVLSKTLIVQNINSYSHRDYGRPKRETHIGMIPPKLAQIMINLAKLRENQTVLDPFCGTGTILQEALLDKHRIVGSDANEKQIENCKENMFG